MKALISLQLVLVNLTCLIGQDISEMRIFGVFYPEVINHDSIVYYNDTGSGAMVIQSEIVDYFTNGHVDTLRSYHQGELRFVWDGTMKGNTYELNIFRNSPNFQRMSLDDEYKIFLDDAGRDSVMERYWKDGTKESDFRYYYNEFNKVDSIIVREYDDSAPGKVNYYYTDNRFDSCSVYQDTSLIISVMAYNDSGEMDSLKINHYGEEEVITVSFKRDRGKVNEMIFTAHDPFKERRVVIKRRKYLSRTN